jgi:hypothetical protein
MGILVGSNGTTARKLAGAFALLCLFALSAGPASAAKKPLPGPAPVASDALTRALARGQLTPAAYALERARSLFHLGAVRREFGDVDRPDPHAATLILRDLALRVRELPTSEKRQAGALLARPSDGPGPDEDDPWHASESSASPVCDANVCIHWVDSTADAPPAADGDANDVPDWVEDVVQPTFAHVWAKEIGPPPGGLGNPAPLSDLSSDNNGGDARLDVYLANLGDDFLFGYCTSDDPNLFDPGYDFFAFSSYCVIDDDFAEFGAEWTPAQFNQVVAAHEFRHASQFSEDFAEDLWLMEGEAMWIEGYVYSAVKDRYDYLETSPLVHPTFSLDHGTDFYEYGAWIFFQFLSENYDLALIRDIWNRADDNGSNPDQYSMQAVSNALSARATSLRSAFMTFTKWNRTPDRSGYYDEGADYPSAPTAAAYKLGRGGTTGWKAPKLRHLASSYYSFSPGSSLSSTAKLKVAVDLPALRYKPAAFLLSFLKSGEYQVHSISLDVSGDGYKKVSFGPGVVSRVDLVLVNASARYNLATCWQDPPFTTYSCGGAVAKDELRLYRFKSSIR